MIDRRFFSPDDYADIQKQYFTKLREHTGVAADPSGWLFTCSHAEQFLRLPRLTAADFSHYYVDEGGALGPFKDQLCGLLSAWEGHPISPEEFTICPSGTCASLVTLAMLKELRVKHVLFETPSYFGTIEQASELGIDYSLIPTYRSDGYALPPLKARITKNSHLALWITQPRASLGYNQSITTLRNILERLGQNAFLISDEVTDQSFPAHLAAFWREQSGKNIIRIRSFTKGMGLNGFRLVAILHPASLRQQILASLETLGGSVDAHSLLAVGALAKDVPRFRSMLKAANEQVNSLRTRVERFVGGTNVTANHLINGYIGSVVADLRKLGRTQSKRRVRLLEECSRLRTPIMLGSTFYMAKDPPTEAIRINYFCHPEHVIHGVLNILQICEST
jgi:DNA-binding transcriptional MocR family regulator